MLFSSVVVVATWALFSQLLAFPSESGQTNPFTTIHFTPQEGEAAEKYWTPAKLAAAVALDDNFQASKPHVIQRLKKREDLTQPVEGVYTIGKLFLRFDTGDSVCSATVISSPQGNIISTAAHCVYHHHAPNTESSKPKQMIFIPNFDLRNPRSQPVWHAVDVLYPATFHSLTLAPRVDYAFIKLRVIGHAQGSIQAYVMGRTGQTPPPRLYFGYRPISYEYSSSDPVDIFGYPGKPPQDLSKPLLKCSTPLHIEHDEPEILRTRACPFPVGCSGGPALIPDSEEPGQRQIGVLSRDQRDTSNGGSIYMNTDIVGFPLSVERSYEDWANLPAQ